MTFKKDDAVTLEMKVIRIDNNDVFTEWMENGVLKQGQFHIDALKPAKISWANLAPKQLENAKKILDLNKP